MKPDEKKELGIDDITPKYSIAVRCVNCSFRGIIKIPKGKTVHSEKCPECGCATIVKSNYL